MARTEKIDWARVQDGWVSPRKSLPEIGQLVDFVFRCDRWKCGLARCHATWDDRGEGPAFYVAGGSVGQEYVVQWRLVTKRPESSATPTKAGRKRGWKQDLSPEERERKRKRMKEMWASGKL